jgi:hypothetical protein
MPLRWRREALLRNRMDAAYVDKLDGKITGVLGTEDGRLAVGGAAGQAHS